MEGKQYHYDIHKPLGIALMVLMGVIAVAFQYKNFDIRSRAMSTPAKIVIDLSQPSQTPLSFAYMQAFSQGGEEKRDMIAPVATAVADLKPKVIRIDHIYDYFVIIHRDNDTVTYDFSALDRVVRSILNTGAIPMLSLGYMPKELSDDGTVIGKPKNWQEWKNLVQYTVKHYSGLDTFNISGIYYEVWNEPDLEQFGLWKIHGTKNYMNLYKYALEGVQSAQNVNPFFIGGPATAKLYKTWINALVASGLRVDFFSWHSYNSNPLQIVEEIQNIQSIISDNERYRNAQILITENGFTSNKDSGYSLEIAAAYTSALMRRLQDNPPKYIFSFELVDGPNDTDSGWGMLTHETKGVQQKSRYTFFKLLNEFSGRQLPVTGEGTFVTCMAVVSGNQIRLLVTNYRYDKENIENTPIKITGLKNGRYQIDKIYLYGRKQTSALTVSGSVAEFSVLMLDKSVVFITISKID